MRESLAAAAVAAAAASLLLGTLTSGAAGTFLTRSPTAESGIPTEKWRPAEPCGRGLNQGASPSAISRPRVAAQSEAGTSTLGHACRAIVAGLCAFVCSTASRAAAQRRISVVARRFHPSCGHRPKQKVLRRLEPYGQIPAWSRRTLIKRRLKVPWRTRTTPKPSSYCRYLIEKQRVRYHYNVKDRQLEGYMRRAFKKGNEWPVDVLLQQLESRLDAFVWRVGLAPTMAGARHFVREGHMQYMTGSMTDWTTCNVPSLRLKIGDKLRVRDKKSSQNYGKLNQDDEGPVPVPDHIKWDREKMEGEYLDVCDWQDFGLWVGERYICLWYSGYQGLRRRHLRYFEGTTRVIKKRYRGGRIRPTPENILNIKRGIGLNKRGRARPPCLWGRRRPLNNPYEVSNRPY